MRRHLILALAPLLLALGPAARAAPEDKHKAGGSSYTPIRTLTANTIREDGRRGVFTVEAGVDAPNPAVRSRVSGLMPRLRDAYAATLQVFAASLRPGQVPDLDLLSRRLQADTDRVVGGPGARLLLGACIVN